MKKIYFLLLVATLFSLSVGHAQTRYTAVFYNVENVFDTIKSPDTYDEEFTPNGTNKWNSAKYWKKMANLEEVFYKIAAANKDYPTIIGLSEIENRNVLEEIASLQKLQKANYQIAHYDSPDARGVDVAFLYRPDQFKYEGSFPIRTKVEGIPNFRTRDVLMMWGTIEGELFYFFVNHWPSRRGGQQASESRRIGAAQTVRHAVDSIMELHADAKIVIMGDLNDDPTDKSIYEVLGAKGKVSEVKSADLFNPYYEMFKKGFGTLAYNDQWNLFDNIIVNGALLHGTTGNLKLQKSGKYYGNIFNQSFLLQQSGQFKGYPFRTYVGGNFQGGYSDHLPVYIFISK